MPKVTLSITAIVAFRGRRGGLDGVRQPAMERLAGLDREREHEAKNSANTAPGPLVAARRHAITISRKSKVPESLRTTYSPIRRQHDQPPSLVVQQELHRGRASGLAETADEKYIGMAWLEEHVERQHVQRVTDISTIDSMASVNAT